MELEMALGRVDENFQEPTIGGGVAGLLTNPRALIPRGANILGGAALAGLGTRLGTSIGTRLASSPPPLGSASLTSWGNLGTLGGAGLQAGGLLSDALGGPPELGFALGQAGNLVSTIGTGAAIGAGSAGAPVAGAGGLVGTGIGSLSGAVIVGAIAAPLLALSISEFIGGLEKADERRYQATQNKRILGAYFRPSADQTLAEAIQAQNDPRIGKWLEAATYTKTRLARQDYSDPQVNRDVQTALQALAQSGKLGEARTAVMRGTAWGGSGYGNTIWNTLRGLPSRGVMGKEPTTSGLGTYGALGGPPPRRNFQALAQSNLLSPEEQRQATQRHNMPPPPVYHPAYGWGGGIWS